MDKLLFNIHDVVLLMIAYQCTLFALLILVIQRASPLSSCLLAAFLFAQAAIPLDNLIHFGTGFRQSALSISPNIFYVFGIAYWLEGPLLLWYVRASLYKDYSLDRKELALLIPTIVYVSILVLTFYSKSEPTKIEILESSTLLTEPIYVHIMNIAREFLRVTFCTMALLAIREFRIQIKNEYSNIEQIDFAWLKFLVVAFLINSAWAVLVAISIFISAHSEFKINYGVLGLTANYAVFILMSAMIFLSMHYSHLFDGIERRDRATDEQTEKTDPKIVSKIESYMLSEKPYLNPLLTLERLANQLEIPQRTLSKTINRYYKKNFFEFINYYRVEESKQKLKDPSLEHETILNVMMACGFNSKATYNTFFKKLESMTPSEYRKSGTNREN